MKAIVHIGAPKTGSSTIQEFLFRNTDALAAQGFRFRRNVEGRGSQYEYPLAALASIDRLLPGEEEQTRYSSTDLATHKKIGAAAMAQLRANLATWREPVALFSSEHIYPWLQSADQVRGFDRLFKGLFDEVRYVLYIRNQEDLLVSEYSEMIKRGSNLRLQTFANRRKASLDYERRVRYWIEAVGRDRFDLRLMEPDFLVGGELLADFAQVCGFTMTGLVVPPRANESLSAPAVECLRILNDRIPQLTHDGKPNPLRLGFVEALMAMKSPDAPRLSLTAEIRAQLRDAIGPQNERLRTEFFPDRASLFNPARDHDTPPRAVVLEQALDLASRLIIRLRMGRIPALSTEEQDASVTRNPGGTSNGIAPAPKPPTPDHPFPSQDPQGPLGASHGHPRQ